jgi:hypothetical protein
MKIEVLNRAHQKLSNNTLFIFISLFLMELLMIENWSIKILSHDMALDCHI